GGRGAELVAPPERAKETMRRATHFILRMSLEEKEQLKNDAQAVGDSAARWVLRCLAFGRASLLPGLAQGAKSGIQPAVSSGIRSKRNGKTTKKAAKRR